MKADMHVHIVPGILIGKTGGRIRRSLSAEETWNAVSVSGAEKMAVLGWPFAGEEDCVLQNDFILKEMQKQKDILLGFGTVNPAAGESAVREAERCLDAGFFGIGELDPEQQGFSLTDPFFERICTLCVSRRRPLCLHAGIGMKDHGTGRKDLLPASYYHFIEKWQSLVLILPHFGGGIPFYAMMPEVGRHLKNVIFDNAPDTEKYVPSASECAELCLKENRLAYGSHFPVVLQDGKETEITRGSCREVPPLLGGLL